MNYLNTHCFITAEWLKSNFNSKLDKFCLDTINNLTVDTI